MCELCVKHGEGKKWYLNAKNYSADLLSDVRRRKLVKDLFYWIDGKYNRYVKILDRLPLNLPVIRYPVSAVVKRMFINTHWGQIIPIEDVENILSMASSIVRIPCACHKVTAGKERRTCFLISLNPGAMGAAEIVDQSFFGGPDVARFERLNKADALDFMREQEGSGLIHSIWTVGTPFTTGLCNCDARGCIAMEMYGKKTPIFFKAEYVARVDRDRCAGCRICVKRCMFGAIEYDFKDNKIEIDSRKCYGCGICRSACRADAIALCDRHTVSEAARSW